MQLKIYTLEINPQELNGLKGNYKDIQLNHRIRPQPVHNLPQSKLDGCECLRLRTKLYR